MILIYLSPSAQYLATSHWSLHRIGCKNISSYFAFPILYGDPQFISSLQSLAGNAYTWILNSCRKERNKEGRKEGRKERRKKGKKEGKKEGRKEEKKEGRKEGRKEERNEGRKEGKKEGNKEGKKEGINKQARKKRKIISSITPSLGRSL